MFQAALRNPDGIRLDDGSIGRIKPGGEIEVRTSSLAGKAHAAAVRATHDPWLSESCFNAWADSQRGPFRNRDGAQRIRGIFARIAELAATARPAPSAEMVEAARRAAKSMIETTLEAVRTGSASPDDALAATAPAVVGARHAIGEAASYLDRVGDSATARTLELIVKHVEVATSSIGPHPVTITRSQVEGYLERAIALVGNSPLPTPPTVYAVVLGASIG